MSAIPRVVISAPSSGHGKSAVAVGLLAACAARGLAVAGFKVGPDYVDAAYLGLAARRPGRNLDPRLVGPARLGPLLRHGAAGADLAVIEGTMGLYDGLAGRTDAESTAQVAGLLRAPVVLVIDVATMGQSVAALVHGFRAYDELLWLGGVILNRVASDRHERVLREALDDIGVPVLGALRRRALSAIGSLGAPLPPRQYGVVPVLDGSLEATRAVRRLGEVITESVEIERLLAVARSAPQLSAEAWSPVQTAIADQSTAEVNLVKQGADTVPVDPAAVGEQRPIIAVAGRRGCTFGYPETVELLRAAGAEVVTVDPLRDAALPDGVDGLVIGGGLPEAYVEELSANEPLRRSVLALARAGKPIVAEATGLLWLCRDFAGRRMCGVLDASARAGDLTVLGYREATAAADSVLFPAGTRVIGHKLHRGLVTPRCGTRAAWSWAGGPPEGFVQGAVHASFLCLHWAGIPHVAARFVAAARRPAPGPAPRPVPGRPVAGPPAALPAPAEAAPVTASSGDEAVSGEDPTAVAV